MNYKGATRWEELAELCQGYLHQDFTPEYGSADAAIRAWHGDAPLARRIRVASEWRSFLNVTRGLPFAARVAALREIAGGAWDPTEAEFERVSAFLSEAWEG